MTEMLGRAEGMPVGAEVPPVVLGAGPIRRETARFYYGLIYRGVQFRVREDGTVETRPVLAAEDQAFVAEPGRYLELARLVLCARLEWPAVF
jgi:hypothetical protein